MRTIRVVLAVRPRLYQDLLRQRLEGEYEVHVVSRAEDELAIGLTLRQLLDEDDLPIDDSVVVIMTSGHTEPIPASVSRLLLEFPEIRILTLSSGADRIRSYQLRIDMDEFAPSMSGLHDAIEECSRNPSLW